MRKTTRGRIYNIWYLMHYRCENPKSDHYKYYGGNGVCICDEWESFEPFYQWAISNGYQQSLTLDRINPFGNYEPSNCRWVDNTTQYLNRCNGRFALRGVIQLSLDNKFIAQYDGIRMAQRAIHAKDHTGIIACCKGKQSKAYGYKWIYQDEYVAK